MHCRFLCAGLLASVAAGAGAAVAADFGVRPAAAPVVAPVASPPPYISEWAGFYIGIHGGGGSGHTSFDPGFFTSDGFAFGITPVSPPNLSPSGAVFGGQAGHNWQWGPLVGGLEIDFSGADLNESETFTSLAVPDALFSAEHKIDALASARARLGYLIFPNWLLYGTAGLGWAHSRFTTTETFLGIFNSQTSYTNEFGWVAGAGLEWKFAEHWFLRGEWLHYDFGKNNLFESLVPGGPLVEQNTARTTVDIGRAALSYKF
jgi:outer membrane immunogenic protein